MSTIQLPLSNGGVTVVDEIDGCFLIGLSLHRSPKGYATLGVNGRCVGLQRVITGLHPTLEADHIDRDKMNNRRGNLRHVTHAQNRMNKGPGTNTGYMRVQTTPSGKFQVMVDKRYIGQYADVIEAARAADQAAYAIFGQFAYLNFPDDYPKPTSNIQWPAGSFVPYALARYRQMDRPVHCKPKKYAHLNWTQIKAVRREVARAGEFMHGGHGI